MYKGFFDEGEEVELVYDLGRPLPTLE